MNPPLFWKSFKKLYLSQSNVNLRSKRWTEEGKPRARQVSQTTCLSLMARVSSGWDFWQNLLQHYHNSMQHLQSLASPHLGFNAELIHLSLWGRYSLLLLCFLTGPLKMPLKAAISQTIRRLIQHSASRCHIPQLTLPRIQDSSWDWTLLLNATMPLAGHCSPSKTQLTGVGHHFCWWNTVWICMSTCHNQKNSSVYWNGSLPSIVALLNVHTQSHL